MLKSLTLLAVLAAGLAAGVAHAAGVEPSVVFPAVTSLLSQPDVALGLTGLGVAGITTFWQRGDILDLTPGADVASGVGYLFGTGLFGVATAAVTSGTEGRFIVEGVVTIGKTSALAIAVGDRVFWDPAAKVVNKTATGQQCVGIAVEAAANPSGTVKIRLGHHVPSAT